MISLEQVLTQRKSALIIVDVQNDFCHPEGSFAKKGMDVSTVTGIIPNIQRLIDAAHAAKLPVIFIQNMEDESTDAEAWLMRPDGDENTPNENVTRRGTWGAEIFRLKPEEHDIVIEKHRFNAFHNTRLDTALRSLGVQSVVVTGLSTNVCVMNTAFNAVMYGYHVVLAEDACAAWSAPAHEFAVNNIRLFVGKVVDTEAVASCWEARGTCAGDLRG